MVRRKRRVRQAGILDVAAQAGVSPATVSRFFNHPDLVRYETRNRILACATELGYVRNRAAGSLNRGRTATVGLVVPTVDNAIFAELIQEFSSSLMQHHYSLLISSHGYDLVHEVDLVRTLLEHQVDGVVLVGAEHDSETFHLLDVNNMPALTVWNWSRKPRVPSIGIDNRELGRLAARHLLDLGHSDIAFLFPAGSHNDRAADRRDGARAELSKSGGSAMLKRDVECPYDIDIAKQCVRDLLREASPPTAILAGNDIIAQAAMYAALSVGAQVPKDLSVIGIGDFHGSAALEPGLTTIRIPAAEIAVSAAETIVEMIDDGFADGDRSQRMAPELMVRGSTASPV
ncbi:MAG: LacI family DNA-binding transcriptional regulator [Pseudomonadota bacterium]